MSSKRPEYAAAIFLAMERIARRSEICPESCVLPELLARPESVAWLIMGAFTPPNPNPNPNWLIWGAFTISDVSTIFPIARMLAEGVEASSLNIRNGGLD